MRDLRDRDGVALPDALRAHGVDLDRALQSRAPGRRRRLPRAAHRAEAGARGPSTSRSAVLGTFGVERHAVAFTGQHAHAGSTPMDVRSDAFLAAARSALAFREDASAGDDVRATTGFVRVSPGIVTAFNGWCELSLDQRALDPGVLADMLAGAQEATRRIAAEEGCEVGWERIWQIEPIPFNPELIDLADEVIAQVAGRSHRLPSGPLHDAAEMARVIPTVMLFVKSLRGLSHTKEEDTPVEDLELSVRALRAHAPDARLGGLTMDFGVTFQTDPPASHVVELTQRAERLGFSHAWTFDSHILWQEPYVIHSQMLAATERIMVGRSSPTRRRATRR